MRKAIIGYIRYIARVAGITMAILGFYFSSPMLKFVCVLSAITLLVIGTILTVIYYDRYKEEMINALPSGSAVKIRIVTMVVFAVFVILATLLSVLLGR